MGLVCGVRCDERVRQGTNSNRAVFTLWISFRVLEGYWRVLNYEMTSPIRNLLQWSKQDVMEA